MYKVRDARGLVLIHPFDDPHVLAGQGTLGLELLDDVPDLGTVVVPIGGGGSSPAWRSPCGTSGRTCASSAWSRRGRRP